MKNWPIAWRLNVGFSITILVLIAISAFAYVSVSRIGDMFAEYRATARQTALIADEIKQMYEARLGAFRYRMAPTDESVAQVEQNIGSLVEGDAYVDIFADDPAFIAQFRGFQDQGSRYLDAFGRMRALQAEHDEMVAVLLADGTQARKNLTEIISTAYANRNVEAAYLGGLVQQELLLGRVYAERFLLKNAQEAMDRSLAQLAEAEVQMVRLLSTVQDPTRQQLAEEARNLIASYAQTLKNVSEVIYARNEIRRGELDTIGPVLAGDFAAMTDKIIDEQNLIGPAAQEKIEELAIVVPVVSGIGTILALLFAMVLSRSISASVKSMANNIRRYASGDISETDEFDAMRAKSRSELVEAECAMRDMGASLRETAKQIDRIANGDLSAKVSVRNMDDQLSAAIQIMAEKLRDVITQIADISARVSSHAGHLSGSASSIDANVQCQADSARSAAAAVEEMVANIRQSSENSDRTERIAVDAADNARQSFESVQEALNAMRTIAERIGVIREIARQTDLLALNAAVEAARAGEHGRGFSVVASEVRKLAERSAAAAEDIGRLSSETMNLSETANTNLNTLVGGIDETAVLVKDISTAAREQSIGADQINDAIRQLDGSIQQNAEEASNVAGAADALRAQIEDLERVIGYFAADALSDFADASPSQSDTPSAVPAAA